MPNKNYLRGRRFEWQVKKDLEAEGWIALRTAGSHGCWDIIAFFHTGGGILCRLIQCKVTDDPKQIKRLVKEFKKKAPFPAYIEGDITQELLIKITGNKEYTLHPLE